MCDVEPTVVRVLDVPAGALLSEVHDLLQAGLGWTNSHLHQFVADGVCYGMADTEGPEDERDESTVLLRSLPARFRYLYDFGDDWEHEVEILGPGGDRPGCVSGEGACPPEDVGGPPGYAELLDVLGDTDHPEHEGMRTWSSHWNAAFDQADTDLFVRRTAGAVPEPVRLVLDLASERVRLTAGGRLPRAFVREVQQRYPTWNLFDRPASREDDLPPLAALHDLLRAVGLLRLRNGSLSPTRAALDDTQAIRRLRSWFGPESGFRSILTGESLASLATAGPCRPGELARRIFPLLDSDRWVTSAGEPLTETMLASSLNHSGAVLVGLDLVHEERGIWSAGPSALWLLPRTTGLAHLWAATPAP